MPAGGIWRARSRRTTFSQTSECWLVGWALMASRVRSALVESASWQSKQCSATRARKEGPERLDESSANDQEAKSSVVARPSWKPALRKLIGPRVFDFQTLKESVWQESAPYAIPPPTRSTAAIVVSRRCFISTLLGCFLASENPAIIPRKI